MYPTHLKKFGLTHEQIPGEGRDAGFRLEGESRGRIVHDCSLSRGGVFSFAKDME